MHQIATSNCFIGPLRNGVLVSQHRNSVHSECGTLTARHYTLAILTIIVSGRYQARHFRQCWLQKLTQRAGHGFSVDFRARLRASSSFSFYLSIYRYCSTEYAAYSLLGEEDAARLPQEQFKGFVLTSELDNRQTLLQINSFSRFPSKRSQIFLLTPTFSTWSKLRKRPAM